MTNDEVIRRLTTMQTQIVGLPREDRDALAIAVAFMKRVQDALPRNPVEKVAGAVTRGSGI